MGGAIGALNYYNYIGRGGFWLWFLALRCWGSLGFSRSVRCDAVTCNEMCFEDVDTVAFIFTCILVVDGMVHCRLKLDVARSHDRCC
jgi:hypothetical protein